MIGARQRLSKTLTKLVWVDRTGACSTRMFSFDFVPDEEELTISIETPEFVGIASRSSFSSTGRWAVEIWATG